MPQINGYNYVLVLPSALFLTTILVPGSNNPALLTLNDFLKLTSYYLVYAGLYSLQRGLKHLKLQKMIK